MTKFFNMFVEVLKDSRGRKLGGGYDAKQGAVANTLIALHAWSSGLGGPP